METISKTSEPISYEAALTLEREGDLTGALSMYEKLLEKTPADLSVLSRLMIVARRLKKFAKELSYINKAIKIHELKYAKLKTKNPKVAALSKQLNNLLGHTDKKGKNLLLIPEVEMLRKRRDIVLKKKK